MKLTLLLLLFFTRTFAQGYNTQLNEDTLHYFQLIVDSLPNYIREHKAQKIAPVCQIQNHFQYSLWSPSLNFSEQALHLSSWYKTAFARMCAYNFLAHRAYAQNKYGDAFIYWRNALDIASSRHFDFDELHDLRPALNNIYFLSGDYKGAMNISTEGLALAEKINDEERIRHFSNVLGCIMVKLNNFILSRQYFSKELSLALKAKDKAAEAHALLNLADLCMAEKKTGEGLQNARNALQIYQHYSLPDSNARKAYIYNKISQLYNEREQYDEALSYNRYSIQLSEVTKGINLYDKAAAYISRGTIFNGLHSPDSAIFFLRIGLVIAKSIYHRENMAEAFGQLALAFEQKRQFDSAYVYQQQNSKLRDSLHLENNEREILQRETDLNIERTKRVQDAQFAKQQFWRNLVIGVAILVIIVLAFFYNRNLLRQKNLYQRVKIRQQQELFNAIASTEEKERKRIARDLHDGLGSVLSAARLKMTALKEARPELAKDEHWQSGVNLLDNASSELRDIAHNIMPATLSRLGLIPAIKNLCDQLSSRLNTKFIAHGFESRLPEEAEITIYRILLELINNIVRHADAQNATVQLIQFPSYMNITVEDDGKGMLPDELKEVRGMGIANVKARVEFLKGRMEIDSVSEKGTTIIIEIPVKIPTDW